MNGQLTAKSDNAFTVSTSNPYLKFFFIFMSIYFLFHIDQSHSLKYIVYVKLDARRLSVNVGSLEYDRQC